MFPQSSVAANNKISLREFDFEHEFPLIIPLIFSLMSIDFFVNTCRLRNKEMQKTFKGHAFFITLHSK